MDDIRQTAYTLIFSFRWNAHSWLIISPPLPPLPSRDQLVRSSSPPPETHNAVSQRVAVTQPLHGRRANTIARLAGHRPCQFKGWESCLIRSEGEFRSLKGIEVRTCVFSQWLFWLKSKRTYFGSVHNLDRSRFLPYEANQCLFTSFFSSWKWVLIHSIFFKRLAIVSSPI